MTMYLEKLPPSSFEHLARAFADRSEIALFRLNFDSLRAQSVLELLLRVGMNLSFCYKFWRIGNEVVASQLEKKNPPNCTTTPSRKLQKRVPQVISLLFIAFSMAVWVFTFQAIQSSRKSCSKYPECVVYSYRREDESGTCFCRILIDVDRAPQTYEEWIHPIDIYENVRHLAAAGELRSLQVINRQLLELPDELRACRQLVSMYVIRWDAACSRS